MKQGRTQETLQHSVELLPLTRAWIAIWHIPAISHERQQLQQKQN